MESERGKSPRVDVDVSAELALGTAAYPAIVRNIGMGGCLIETPARPRMREIVSLRIRPGTAMEKIPLKVVWQSYGAGTGKIGARFQGMTAEQTRNVVAGILGLSTLHGKKGEEDEES